MARRFVTDRDRGYRDLLRNVGAGRHGQTVKVGIQGSKATEPKEEHDGTTGAADLVTVASWLHFGTDVIEGRPFIAKWVDENRRVILERLHTLAGRIMRNEITMQQGLDLFGLWAVGQIQTEISEGVKPENSPATIARKGSSTPLIDTGQLRSSITHLAEAGLAALGAGGA